MIETKTLFDSDRAEYEYMQEQEARKAKGDPFFTQKTCDRCGGSLECGRTMSMYNKDCICMACYEAEKKRPDYNKAVEADRAEILKGNYNFKGIGYKDEH